MKAVVICSVCKCDGGKPVTLPSGRTGIVCAGCAASRFHVAEAERRAIEREKKEAGK